MSPWLRLKTPNLQITLGTTRKNAGSAEAFEAIDRGYPVLLAKLARTEGKSQKVVYLSVRLSRPPWT